MPIDRGIIDQQLQAIGASSRWWDHREMRDLPATLHADEHIIAISRGKLARVRWLRRPWLIIITNARLLCLRSAGRTGWRQLEVRGDLISRVTLRIGPFRGRVLVVAGGDTYRMLVPRTDAYKLVAALTRLGPRRDEALSGAAPTLLVRRVIDHVLALPAAAFNPDSVRAIPPAAAPDVIDAFDQRVQVLEDNVQQLQQQVEFLEELLEERQVTGVVPEEMRTT